jgi:hypothetical protein
VSVVFGGKSEDEAGVSGIVCGEGLEGRCLSRLVTDEEEEGVSAVLEDLFNGVVVEGKDLREGEGEEKGC